MDPHYSKAVLTAFVDLFGKGNIYRGKRMVNWCPASQTALSDEEVNMKPVNGSIYRVRYERTDAPGVFVEVKTRKNAWFGNPEDFVTQQKATGPKNIKGLSKMEKALKNSVPPKRVTPASQPSSKLIQNIGRQSALRKKFPDKFKP
jgi:hypothetical protein